MSNSNQLNGPNFTSVTAVFCNCVSVQDFLNRELVIILKLISEGQNVIIYDLTKNPRCRTNIKKIQAIEAVFVEHELLEKKVWVISLVHPTYFNDDIVWWGRVVQMIQLYNLILTNFIDSTTQNNKIQSLCLSQGLSQLTNYSVSK